VTPAHRQSPRSVVVLEGSPNMKRVIPASGSNRDQHHSQKARRHDAPSAGTVRVPPVSFEGSDLILKQACTDTARPDQVVAIFIERSQDAGAG
jgi:hypothetical protein